jgi:hypothetical protein
MAPCCYVEPVLILLHSEELGGIPLVQDVADMEGAGWGTIHGDYIELVLLKSESAENQFIYIMS